MKVYLSGKITGDSNYRQKFNTMTEELLSYGYVVFNPAVLPDGFEYSSSKYFLYISDNGSIILYIMDTMDNLCTAKELAEKWGVTVRMVTLMCTEGKIPGAKKFGNSWVIPKDTEKPLDGRTKEAKEAR